MQCIPYPHQRQSSDQSTAQQYHPLYKKIIRSTICGLLFAIPFCVAAPSSPLLKLSQTQNNKRSLVPRMMSDFFYVNFISSSMAYWFLVEPFSRNPKAMDGFMPYLGPLTAQIPGTCCLIGSHLFYPGMWAIFNEVTWKARRREFVRLNVKCFFAYSPVHVPATVGMSAAIGTLLFPFKFFKDRALSAEARQLAASATAVTDADIMPKDVHAKVMEFCRSLPKYPILRHIRYIGWLALCIGITASLSPGPPTLIRP